MREKLVRAILDFAADEITEEYLKHLAIMSKTELLDQLINMTAYFKNEIDK